MWPAQAKRQPRIGRCGHLVEWRAFSQLWPPGQAVVDAPDTRFFQT
jgi:hypothetical protein